MERPKDHPSFSALLKRRREPARELIFSPLAWLKLQFFLHAGDTEVGGFAISRPDEPLYVEEFITVKQIAGPASIEFDDAAVADYFDQCVDRGLKPAQFARIWMHTHPGESPNPSNTDEDTFERAFGNCDWSIMFILGRTGRTYARLFVSGGPGAQVLLPVQVDWERWPEVAADPDHRLDDLIQDWLHEYMDNVQDSTWSIGTGNIPGEPSPMAGDLTDWDEAYFGAASEFWGQGKRGESAGVQEVMP